MPYNQVFLDLQAVENRIELFCQIYPNTDIGNVYLFDKSISDIENLNRLAFRSLEEQQTLVSLFVYRPIFLDVVARWVNNLDENRILLILEATARIITLFPSATTLVDKFLHLKNEKILIVLQNYLERRQFDQVRRILLSYYRLLYQNKDLFSNYIRPDCLFSILNRNESSDVVKYISVHILALYLDMAEYSLNKTLQSHVSVSANLKDIYEGINDIDYRFLVSNEACRFSFYSKLPNVPENFNPELLQICYSIDPKSFHSDIVSVCGKLIPKVRNDGDSQIARVANFVPIEKSIVALRKLASSISQSKPVMLIGASGSGKTFLVSELANYSGCKNSLIKIHLGEQTDAKLLIGTYVSGVKPGTFEWKAGVLTNAVKEGRWVLVEDIDKAPTEVLSILLSLLEKRELVIPSRGEVVKAASGFQLISTVCSRNESSAKTEDVYVPNLIGMRAWDLIHLEEPADEELKLILVRRFPVLENMVPKLINAYKSTKAIYSNSKFLSLNKGAQARGLSVRDLVKLFMRLTALFTNNNITSPNQLIESSIYDSIFSETVDCFASAITEPAAFKPIISTIAEALDVTASRCSTLSSSFVPSLEIYENKIIIGRATLKKSENSLQKKSVNLTSFAATNHSLKLMEQIGVAIELTEPVLLVGETGTGKTTVVQQLAKLTNKPLTVINVSQQTETSDLLGGYKPINSKSLAVPIQEQFEALFSSTFSMKKNEKFYKLLHRCFNKSQWKNVVKLWKEAYKMALTVLDTKEILPETSQKKKRKIDKQNKVALLKEWNLFVESLKGFEAQSSALDTSFVFSFVEGSLMKAVRNGEWLLLDEINLASADTLESISDLLIEAESRTVLLSEKGDTEPVLAHPDFRIFGCMNPATDVGKRDLPAGVRSRFAEIYVHSPDRDITDLLAIIDKYIGKYSVSDEWIGNDIAEVYLEAKRLAENNKIVDGSNQKPHFSIRTLTRTLLYVRDIVHIYGLRRSLYDGFCMSFLTLLDLKSETILRPIIEKFTLGRLKNMKSAISNIPPCPGPDYVQFKHYWIPKGNFEIKDQSHYIVTPFVEKNLMNLVRATSGKRFPILIQGPTSAGKTSMIKYLADITGHKFVRINNHEHTDLQEYLGTYVNDDTGKLSFKEGVLVEALRKGYWIVLDELNLAPTDVLEALNRLLDDNRELFIPETQEVVHPHPEFMLFATQNPPGLYGGRKILSRAFRNRFLELHFDDIPEDELEIIIKERCKIAPSYAKKIVDVYKQLSVERSAARVFEKKNSFATLRDLFRWALREAITYEQLAANGYMLLAERCRAPNEKQMVKEVLEKVMRVKLNMDEFYTSLENPSLHEIKSNVVWTKALRRLAVLVMTCIKNNEPILLVGETGCGKTTVFQLLAKYMSKNLLILNAHQNTETGDILGAQRPVRNRSEVQAKLKELLQKSMDITDSKALEDLLALYQKADKQTINSETVAQINQLKDQLNILFEWCDGPLIQALKDGEFFLLDEISLADDSVLERLNSVLEPERSLLLAEKGYSDSLVVAKNGFQFFATMNPGGDYGKKELSPALRNRFTEIWVPSMESFTDVKLIVDSKLSKGALQLSEPIVDFSEWYGNKFGGGNATSGVISLRDILAWIEFINRTVESGVELYAALIHGAMMVFIDALGTNNTAYLAENEENLKTIRKTCVSFLSETSKVDLQIFLKELPQFTIFEDSIQIDQFKLNRDSAEADLTQFNMNAPTTVSNLMRVVRAMQVPKPILLEGSPGVGKTSLITAMANLTGNNLTRINLSEQTDLIDLFGSDAPGSSTGEFVWHDAPFLRAMQQGEWVLLDEMNLASQSVLEGLNACLDHRGEAYIPELDKTFTRHPDFLVFAAQNPQYQGGGRKGLPKSFVNRFSVVYVDMLTSHDLKLIANHLYPSIHPDTTAKIISLMSTMEDLVVKKKQWGLIGSPWEFNLRDALRWLKSITGVGVSDDTEILKYFKMIIKNRFRTLHDQAKAQELADQIFDFIPSNGNYIEIDETFIQINNEICKRNSLHRFHINSNLIALQCNLEIYEFSMKCINNNWPLILTGPSNSGKTDIIRYLASILGAKLDVFSMNHDVDSMDILGGYEQVDITRKISLVVGELLEILYDLVTFNISQAGNADALQIATRLIHHLKSTFVTPKTFSTFYDLFNLFSSYLPHNENLIMIKTKIETLHALVNEAAQVKFEWFDGMLISAVEKGHWLILDNANLCSPSVLDRLNSLLESNGSLLVNECSDEDGLPRVIIPHPNFRLFLTVNPKYGELSRAMRNRGIELFVDEIFSRASDFDKKALLIEEKPAHESRSDFELSTNASLIHFIPTQNFISSYLSESVRYAKIMDVFVSSNCSVMNNTLLSLVSSNNVENIINWGKNMSKLMRHNSQFMTKFVQIIGSFEKSGLIADMRQVQVPVVEKLSNRFGLDNAASIDKVLPMLNVYTKSMPELSESIAFTSQLLYIFDSIELIHCNRESLNVNMNKAINGKATELNYLELSMAIALGRNVKLAPRIPVFNILKNINDWAYSAITNKTFQNCQTQYYMIWKLLALSKTLYNSSDEKNEAKLRAFQNFIRKWEEEMSFDSNALEVPEISALFDSSISLTRGLSMNILWNAYRNSYPSNEEGWKAWFEVVELSKKFDTVSKLQFSDSYSMINELRQSFMILFDDLINNKLQGLSEIMNHINKTVDLLGEISESFLLPRKHYLQDEFDILAKYLFHYEIESEALRSFVTYSSLTILQVTKLEKKLFVHPPVFDLLWNKDKDNDMYESSTNVLFDSTLIENLISKSGSLGLFPGSQFNQIVDDIKTLSCSIIRSSSELLTDQLEKFRQILLSLLSDILMLHVSTDFNQDSLSTIKSRLSEQHDASILRIFTEYLEPAILLLQNAPNQESLGKAWVYFGSALVYLFAPDESYDPAINDYVAYDIYAQIKEETDKLISSWRTIGDVTSGDAKIFAEDLIQQVSDNDIPSKPRVYRPKKSIDGLFEEWSAFINSALTPEQITSKFKLFESWNKIESNQLEIFQQNSSHFLNRLNEAHAVYSDVNDIFTTFVLSVKFGFDLMKHHKENDNRMFQVSPLNMIDPLTLINASSIDNVANAFFKISKSIDAFDLDVEKISAYLLYLFKFQNRDSNLQATFTQVLKTIYYRWSLRRMKEEEEAAIKSSTFKYEDNSDNYEKEFKELFPSYEDVLEINSESSGASTEEIDQIYFEIATSYMQVFEESDIELKDVVLKGSSISEIFSKLGSKSFKTHNITKQELSSSLLILESTVSSINGRGVIEDFDFYKGSSLIESQNALSVVDNLWKAVDKLLKQWPDHATLKDIFRICLEFLEYPTSTPLAKQIQKIEQIYTFVTEWEKYASSKVSLSVHAKTLSDLIISWRKLELRTFNSLINYEETAARKPVGKWWFYLFESIIIANMDAKSNSIQANADQVSLVSALNTFFNKATYGEYVARFELAKAFRNHINYLEFSGTKLFNALSNSISFYEQFVPIVNEHISSNKKALQKEINEVILLASWKDVNIHALKQSSQKSHQSLFKIVRKYRAVLNANIQPIIENGVAVNFDDKISSSKIKAKASKYMDLKEVQNVVANISSWSSRTGTMTNIEAVSRNLEKYHESFKNQKSPSFVKLVNNFKEEADFLKKETPSTYTKNNEKKIKSLKAQKAKLFSTALKEFRRIGLKTSFREDYRKVQISSTAILSNAKSFIASKFESCDTDFYKVVDILPRLRSTVSAPKEDVPVANIEKAMAIIENLVFTLVTMRTPMSEISSSYSLLESMRSDLQIFSTSNGYLCHSKLAPSFESSKKTCFSISKLLDYAISVELSICGLTSKENDTKLLQKTKTQVDGFKTEFKKYNICDSTTENLLIEFDRFLTLLSNTLVRASNDAANGFLYSVILEWLNSNKFESSEAVPSEIKIADIDEAFRKVHSSILIAYQTLLAGDTEIYSTEDDKWLQMTLHQMSYKLRKNNITAVNRNLKNALKLIKSNFFCNSDSVMVKAIVGFTMPLIDYYYKTINMLMNQFHNDYGNLSNGCYTLAVILNNLARNGFCSPEIPSEEVDDKNLQEGTGLGDGEGADNNSKDVEQDEDLTENAQNANDDQKNEDEREDDDNDEAVEMEGDMAGNMEDLSDQEDEESDDNQEDEDLDEEIDDLNDDDPNTIDEKLWDEEAADNSKEKISDKNLNSKDDDDVEAGENDENKGDDGDQEQIEDQNNQPEESVENDNDGDNDQKDDEQDDGSGSEEEDVGEQADEVRNEDGEELEENVPESEVLELPDEMNLDEDEEDGSGEDDGLDDDIDMKSDDGSEEDQEKTADGEQDQERLDDADNNSIAESENENESNEDIQENNEQSEGEGANDIDGEKEEVEAEAELSEEEVMNNEEEKETKAENGENPEEGLDGVDDMADDAEINIEASIQQQSGHSGEGADNKDTEEQNDIGASGDTQNAPENDKDMAPETNETSREEAKEALKQLGDSMKEFHRRRQEIQENSNHGEENEEIESKNQRKDEFEHVDGANTETDTQAMGAANEDDIQNVNEDMAIDDESDDIEMKDESDHNDAVGENMEDVLQEQPEGEDEEQVEKDKETISGGFIGEKKEFDESKDLLSTFKMSESDEEDELNRLMNDIDIETQELDSVETPPITIDEARELWRQSEVTTADFVARLGEQLRLILEPTLATKLRGDYKTGKRLNMKRIIPYIASQFRKDKIWLRRTKPSKRQYQIMIALDDSKSMSESNCVKLAHDSMCLVSKTLTQLEAGSLSIVKFGELTREVHSFDQQFSNDSGAKVFQWFGFQQAKTDITKLVSESIKIFERAQTLSHSDDWKLQIIISDGICEDHETVQRLVRRAREKRIMLIFVIIDGINAGESIMEMSQVRYVPDEFNNMKLKIDKYLDSFPFEYYVVVHDVSELPEMLSTILRQYFSELALT